MIVFCVKAQYTYTPNTYYLIPPTNGCDGIWAVKDAVACSVYQIAPCWDFDHFNGDTIFLKLCSIPCTFYATTNSGDICVQAICAPVITRMDSKKYSYNHSIVSWLDNNTIKIDNEEKGFDNISFLSALGQKNLKWNNIDDRNLTYNTENLQNGIYILKLSKKQKIVSIQSY